MVGRTLCRRNCPFGDLHMVVGPGELQQAVGGGGWVQHSRLSPTTWSYVASYEWPRQMGWVVLALAAVYCIGCVRRKDWRLPKHCIVFPCCVAAPRAMPSSPSLQCPRSATLYSLSFPLCSSRYLRLSDALPARIAAYVAVLFAVWSLGHTLIKQHIPRITGYREAAHYVCSVAPADSAVLFSGWRDGSFVFNIKTLPECKNLTVIRADKLLLRVAIHRDLFGVQELGVAEDKLKWLIGALLGCITPWWSRTSGMICSPCKCWCRSCIRTSLSN